MRYTPLSLCRLIQRVINNEPCLEEWDDLVSISHKDAFTELMDHRLLGIQIAYADLDNHVLVNEKGVHELEQILAELHKMDAGSGSDEYP